MRALIMWLLLITSAAAQSVPNPETPIVQNKVWRPDQWVAAWKSKVDVKNGALTNPTINGGVISGSDISALLTSPPSLGSIVPNSGAFTTLSSSGVANLNAGGALVGTFSGNKTFTGTTALNQTLTLGTVNSHFQQYFNNLVPQVAAPNCATAQQFWCVHFWPSGTVAAGTNFMQIDFQDVLLASGSPVSQGLYIQHNIAPSGNTATGNRITLSINQAVVGSAQSGTYTNTGINQVAQFTAFNQSNEGGSSTQYQGSTTVLGLTCTNFGTATFVVGCAGQEIDIASRTSSSFDFNRGLLLVHTSDNQVQGRVQPDIAFTITDQSGGAALGYKNIFQLGEAGSLFPGTANTAVIYAAPSGSTANLATAIDVTQVTFSGCDYRAPFSISCPIQATGITSVTRLTSDGAAASSYVYQAVRDNAGSGYTTYPTITVNNCTGAAVNSVHGNGNVIGVLGVNTPGTNCAAEATLSFSGGGGTSGAGHPVIAGNTLNFPIKSTVRVSCVVAASTLNHSGTDAVGWSITFGATMGATASTTAIVGSPTWTLDYGTTGAAAKFSGSSPAAPTADTTFGAVNLSLTPTSGTWDVGGRCNMTKSAQT